MSLDFTFLNKNGKFLYNTKFELSAQETKRVFDSSHDHSSC